MKTIRCVLYRPNKVGGVMELTSLPMFALIRQRMNWLNQRQEVIAQNVANANTPDYPSQDLKPAKFRSDPCGYTL